MKENADEAPVVEHTPRRPCRVCGRLYVWPKGSRAPGGVGPCCQLSLEGEVHERGRILDLPGVELVDDPDERRERPPLPNADDVLCAGCKDRLAAGVLEPPGIALCVDCADELLDHWLAWLEDPSHDWWAADDVFGSVRRPLEGWRATELLDGRVRS